MENVVTASINKTMDNVTASISSIPVESERKRGKTYSADFRWRCVVLRYVYSMAQEHIHLLMGVSVRSLRRWNELFHAKGTVVDTAGPDMTARFSQEVYDAILKYVDGNPTFYLEELQDWIQAEFPSVRNVSIPTLCRALRHDLKLTRKVLQKRAKEASLREQIAYSDRLSKWYMYPEQLVFCDESSKDGRSVARRYGRSKMGSRCIVNATFSRGKRVSVLAGFDVTGFIGWGFTAETFDRHLFHATFAAKILPLLNPWPLPRSIVILDNARIHMYKELEDMIHAAGAVLIYLPPYSPHLSPIETGFSLLKAWLVRHANLIYGRYPAQVMEVALMRCTREENVGHSFFAHSGYHNSRFRLPDTALSAEQLQQEQDLVILFEEEEDDDVDD